ncbi:ABC transporter ATP-binding protein [Legionella worsleiensis]|uniref:ABC transporter ATP-binding protein n=1 Tax=Legionella worsleiensis TaxID=45076 RepID=A0A0W1A5Q3_9GAMM|nr:ABC transporter ATP-binding protein [Legionella worsleiensis]KTD76670.1 ABC transporter ATP-binding protein [Legionella worsleiensis]STY30411.1 ABC transporter ATP-binding protein [Legionella worsleiensis]
MASVIQLQNVNKAFADRVVFENLSYTFQKRAYHIIGKNGSGKSTLLRLIVGLDAPDSGFILINNRSYTAKNTIKPNNLFYVPDDLAVYPFLTGKELISWLAKARTQNDDEVNQIFERLELQAHLNTRISEMSFGTKKKFLLSSALIGQPDFIILDEPLNGLDKKSQRMMLTILQEKAANCGIILTSHHDDFFDELNPVRPELAEHRLFERTAQLVV